MFSPVTRVVLGVLAVTAALCVVVVVLSRKGMLGWLDRADQPWARNAVAIVGSLAPLAAFVMIITVTVQQGLATARPVGESAAPVRISPPDRGDAVPAPDPEPTPTPTAEPSVESVAVSVTALAGCSVQASGSVLVTGAEATVTYRILVNGVQTGPTRSVTGTGRLYLQSVTADSSRAGRVTYQVLSPNAVSGTRTWAAATGCQTGTTTSAPASPAFTLGQPSVSPSTFAGDCATASFTLNGTVTVTSPPGGLTLTYAVLVNQVQLATTSGNFPVGTTPISASFTLPAGTESGVVSVRFSAGSQSSPVAELELNCQSSPPPPEPT